MIPGCNCSPRLLAEFGYHAAGCPAHEAGTCSACLDRRNVAHNVAMVTLREADEESAVFRRVGPSVGRGTMA